VPTDAELVKAARAGRRRAFDALIDRYERRALSVAYRLLGNLHDALEVTQEAFVRAYRGLDRLVNPDRFGAWLLRIVTNMSLNRRRARRPRLTIENGTLDSAAVDDVIADNGGVANERPSARMVTRELAERIREALAQLPERQRAALVLYSVEQLPQRQVAQILGCSVEAVKWHVFQARKKLKICLGDYL
jgi:RNA polymerase sigma-70 factor (ECF subfamily)